MERIIVPSLVTYGAGDPQIPLEYARVQHDATLNSPDRELHVFTEREGGVDYVGGDNMLPAASFIADWVADRL